MHCNLTVARRHATRSGIKVGIYQMSAQFYEGGVKKSEI